MTSPARNPASAAAPSESTVLTRNAPFGSCSTKKPRVGLRRSTVRSAKPASARILWYGNESVPATYFPKNSSNEPPATLSAVRRMSKLSRYVFPCLAKFVFCQPGIKAGLFRALPAVGRAGFQLGDLLAEVRVELLFAPDAAAHQSVRRVSVRYAFGKPQCARELLLCMVHRFERRRADALHIPEMKKFVCRDTRQIFIGRSTNRSRIRVLHATATGSLANMKYACVPFEWRSLHELQFVIADPPQILFDLFLPPVIPINDN